MIIVYAWQQAKRAAAISGNVSNVTIGQWRICTPHNVTLQDARHGPSGRISTRVSRSVIPGARVSASGRNWKYPPANSRGLTGEGITFLKWRQPENWKFSQEW